MARLLLSSSSPASSSLVPAPPCPPPSAFSALASSIKDATNLKVKIHASIAVRVPQSRISFGPALSAVLEAVTSALANAGEIRDFYEFKYQAALERQVRT